jgi:hypothetical protein
MMPQKQTADSINQQSDTTNHGLTSANCKHRRFEPLQAHHLTSLTSEHSALKCNTPQPVNTQRDICLRKFGQNPTINESDETPGRCFSNKGMTASKDQTPNCCLRNKNLTTASQMGQSGELQHNQDAASATNG